MIWIKLLKHLFALFVTLTLSSSVNAETDDQRIKIALRTIGHEFLLQLNDSTSRVLPIENIDGRYAVQFEREFSFEPDFLFIATFKELEESKIMDGYIVEVEECETKKVVHSFETNRSKNNDSLACKLRELPESCYIFYFTLIEGNQLKESWIYKSWSNWYLIIILVIAAIAYLIKKKRSQKLKADLIDMGKFQFDQKGMSLHLKEQSIELSSKETDLLFLLFSNENKTLEREYILKVVWGDEGDYVGRTLDVFISKLRKKLEADSSLKIINVRGVGYRFVIK